MIKEALEYLVGLRRPTVEYVKGRPYSTDGIDPVTEPVASTLKMSTLTALVDFIASDADRLGVEAWTNYIIHVISPTRVDLQLPPEGDFKVRPILMTCAPEQPRILFDNYLAPEQMVVSLQTGFVRAGDWDKVMAVAGNVTESAARSYSDDGMSQAVTMKAGVATKADVVLPNPVSLAPYRTFQEIEQPASGFVFRARAGGEKEKPSFALFEADGGAWRLEAMKRIRVWIESQLVAAKAASPNANWNATILQ